MATDTKKDPNKLSAGEVTPSTIAMRVSLGDPAAEKIKSDGIEMRGAGAATKGKKCTGPMA